MDETLQEHVRRVEAADGQVLALTEIAAARPGGGPAFLLLHGFAQNRRAFTLGPLPRLLVERGARVFAGELRGHGDSRTGQRDPWTLATHLHQDCPALLAGVREATGAERVHLVGHSMGGLLGCALLAGDAPLASLTALATPIVLGAGRPLLRLASLAAGPLATLAPKGRRVPIHLLLGVLSHPLSRRDAALPLRMLQRLTRLANPALADPEAVRAILANADPESPAVFEELAANAVLTRPRIAGVDLVQAVRQSPLPIAAVVGTRDVIAPPPTVASLAGEGHAGPRRIVEVEGGAHVDAAMGHHLPDTLARIWDFLGGATGTRRPAA